ncbi:MAG: hypothetical protein C4B56_03505 [Candidatus Methanophagaceae archaeon]|nr:MAG: hypothetical protein C4B56_03505 [Methanophagales archaeon]
MEGKGKGLTIVTATATATASLSLILITLLLLSLSSADAGTGVTPISQINDSDVGRELTVSGIISAVLYTNSSSSSCTARTYEPGDAVFLTLHDNSGYVLISVDPELWNANLSEGEKIMVTGIYAGNSSHNGMKGTIYASRIRTFTQLYRDRKIKELLNSPEDYFQADVRIIGIIKRIEIEPDKMVLGIDDGSAQIDVLCHTERENISIGDEVVVEGEFMRNMIYAFAIQVQKQKPEIKPLQPTPSPIPTATATPTPINEPSHSSSSPLPSPSIIPLLPGSHSHQQVGNSNELFNLIFKLRELFTHPSSSNLDFDFGTLLNSLNRLKSSY